jgi:hypothetical protein
VTEYERLVDALLHDRAGHRLADWLAERRQAGASYRRIARELYDATGGVVAVNDVTIVNWHRALYDEEPVA